MQPRLRTPPGAMPDFTPVPRRHARADGWTDDRQREFIAGLAETGSVLSAARRVGMSREGAYALRLAPGADSFRAAWATAQRGGIQRLADIAMERAIDGVAVPIHYHGEQVGERRSYNDRLLMFLMRHHDPATYGTTGISGTRSARLDAAEDRDIQAEAAEAMLRIRARLTRARRLMLCLISPDPAKRAAWEVLVGAVDWDRADQLLSQDNEPFNDDPADARPPSMRGPDMMVVAENGLLADICGGEDAMEMIRELVAEETARLREAGPPDPLPGESHEEQAARMETHLFETVEHRLYADGWRMGEEGKWQPPSGQPDGEIDDA